MSKWFSSCQILILPKTLKQMKKIILLITGILVFSSCLNSNDNAPSFTFEYLAIDDYEVPTSFTFGEIDTIKVKYSLPNGCYSFDQIYYETRDTTRIIAVTALVALDKACTQAITQEEHEFTIRASQTEDYILKFFKGIDRNGENIFEEVIVPVN